MSKDKPYVSVIIPVFNDAERLKICLAALENQTYPQSLYEVIVVDNGSNKGQSIPELVAQFGQAKAAHESIIGSYAARNTGIVLATGDVLAFTDADCIPAHNWLDNGVKALLELPGCGLVAGEVAVFFKESARPNVIELYDQLFAFTQKTFIEKYKFGVTANIFTYSRVMNHAGLFDASFKSGGDFEWGQRVFSLGYSQIFISDVRVSHPALYSWRQLYKKQRRIAGGLFNLQRKKYESKFAYCVAFILRLTLDFLSPAAILVTVYRDARLNGCNQKLKVFCIATLIVYVRFLEKLRLLIGGISVRE